MKDIFSKNLLFILLSVYISCNSANPGYTDHQALIYDSLANEDDGNCKYQITTVSPEWSKELGDQIVESSGLIFWEGVLWTMNDDTDTRLFQVDTGSAMITDTYFVQGVVNHDWEEMAQDLEYIYVGDFGNNGGDRKDLHILRIQKKSMSSDQPVIDTIWFSYSDQRNFDSNGFNQTDFDCEAFIIVSDQIYLFTKQWMSMNTTLYELSKKPGAHVAQKREVFPIDGLVTGATCLEEERLLVLCGYIGFFQPFLYLFYDYEGDGFFSGTHLRINLNLPLHQVESVCTLDGIHYYITNERYKLDSRVNIPQKLHKVDLSEHLEAYLGARRNLIK